MYEPTNHAIAGEQVREQLTRIRDIVDDLATRAKPRQMDTYVMVSSLLEAAEALLEGTVDERIVSALGVLADMLSAELDGDPAEPDVPLVLSA
ncbi:MAG TPA: hypothetical protein VD886_11010 [Herpetosiphonaceae bacterium]|nr:hypothetical protein [Herpetosiphonaceae bacterium]